MSFFLIRRELGKSFPLSPEVSWNSLGWNNQVLGPECLRGKEGPGTCVCHPTWLFSFPESPSCNSTSLYRAGTLEDSERRSYE